MRCEIVAVGTELLLGQIVDTNSSWMGERLALAGIDSHFQVKVGDNQQRIVDTIRHALSRSDAVILCGGLGPTQDDITREAIAEVMGVALVRDHAMGEKIRRGFEARGRRFTENNLRQADCPAGASFIPQMPGTAPGLICPVGERVIYAVPGVPFEMREMMEGTILPDLQRRAGVSAVIRSRVLKSWGESESRLAELLAERIEALDRAGNPTIAFQASGIEGLKIRITAKAEDESRGEVAHRRGGGERARDRRRRHLREPTRRRWSRWSSICYGSAGSRSRRPSPSPEAWWERGSPRCPARATSSAARWCRTQAR